jgi:hypothetical protein
MSQVAETLLDVYFQLSFASEDYVELDWALKRCAEIRSDIETKFSEQERADFMRAAATRLKAISAQPFNHGYTPKNPFGPEQREFLEAIEAGRFDGSPKE